MDYWIGYWLNIRNAFKLTMIWMIRVVQKYHVFHEHHDSKLVHYISMMIQMGFVCIDFAIDIRSDSNECCLFLATYAHFHRICSMPFWFHTNWIVDFYSFSNYCMLSNHWLSSKSDEIYISSLNNRDIQKLCERWLKWHQSSLTGL